MSTALDEKTDDIRLEHVEMKSSFESAVLADNAQEHTMTLASAFRKHPKIILWSFFWCLCAVGWGFDTQVNGAMISVPEFRAYYGYIYEGEPVIAAHWQAAFNVVSSVGQFFGGKPVTSRARVVDLSAKLLIIRQASRVVGSRIELVAKSRWRLVS